MYFTPIEQKELDDFLEENLSSGRIEHSPLEVSDGIPSLLHEE